MKHHRRIDPVQELRLEPVARILHSLENALFHLLVVQTFRIVLAKTETQAPAALNQLRPQVGSHHNHRVLEINLAPLRIGQVPVLKNLQQNVEHIRVGLFDLIEENDRIRATAHGLSQLAALIEPDIAGRRPDQPRHGVLLHELGHIETDHRIFLTEHVLGKLLHTVRLTHTGRTQEQESTDRALRVLQASP